MSLTASPASTCCLSQPETARPNEAERQAAATLALGAADVGDRAPGFMMSAAHGGHVILSDELRRRPVLLTFVRGSWCACSRRRLDSLSALRESLGDAGPQILALSPQLLRHTQRDQYLSRLPFPVLSDSGNLVARKYGVDLELSPEMQEPYRRIGIDLHELNGPGEWRLPLSATFLIGSDGIISWRCLGSGHGQFSGQALRDVLRRQGVLDVAPT